MSKRAAGSVTILIPTVDRYPYLETLLDQLRRQTVPPLEIVIVDQTPRDRRRFDLVEKFSDLPIQLLQLDRAGQCSSRNAGIAASRGEFLLFIDDDDEVPPDLIEKHLESLERFRNDVSCGVADEDGAGPLPAAYRLTRASDGFPTNNSMIRMRALAGSGLFDLAFDRGARADADLGMRLYLSGQLMVLNSDIHVLHRHAPSGGLRTHGARVITYASSRNRLSQRHLLTATEIYGARRYFSPRQVEETLWLSALGTFSVRGGRLKRAAKAGLALLLLPHSLWTMRQRWKIVDAMLREYPRIPPLSRREPRGERKLMRNLIFVSTEFPPGPGGIGTHAHQLSLGLAAAGWAPVVLSPQDYATEAEIRSFNAAQPFPIVRLRRIPGPPFEAIYRAGVLGRWIGRHRPEVLIASGSRSVMLVAARVRGRGVPWVAIGHGTEFGSRTGVDGRLLRWAFGQATSVVCVSEFSRRRMHDAGISAREELVIPNGADPSRFRRLPAEDALAARREIGLENARILITVGNVTERKGQDVVVRALPEILRAEPETHYVVAGLPTRGDELRELARGLHVADRVHLLGRVEPDRLTRLLNAADLFVMTSRNTASGDVEGYGIAAVEAALCGVPSVVAGGSGLAEAVVDGETGVVVPPEDPAATARAIVALLGDDAGRRAMGERARRRAEREQTWTGCAARYSETLGRICGASSAGGPPRPLPLESRVLRRTR